MKKAIALITSVVMGASLLQACSSGNKDNETKTEKKNDFKIGMVTGMGGIDDKSFNQSTWEGLQEFAKNHNLKVGEDVRYTASNSDADYVPGLSQYAENKYDLAIGVSFLIGDAVKDVAKTFPEQKFAIVDSVVEEPNVASITFKEHEGSFLAGVAAGMQTKSNKVAFVGGVKSDLIRKFETGFKAGVKTVNPKAEVMVQYVGNFEDAAKGTAIANSLYGQGVDVIFHAAGGSGNGIFTEAKNRSSKGEKVWVIGVDRDQHEEGLPENVTLTSMVKKVNLAVRDISEKTLEGKFPGGETVEYGLKEDGVGLSEKTENLSKEIQDKVKEVTDKIKNGEIVVPSTEKELKAYKF